MYPLYLYAAGGFLAAAGELYCGYLNGEGIISLKNAAEVGLMWPAVACWLGLNLAAEAIN
jgi:hypothetical protein